MNPDDDKLNNSESENHDNHSQHMQENPGSSENQNDENIHSIDPGPNDKSQENSKEPRNIFRAKNDRIFLGVCGGLASYFDSEPLFFRLAFIISVIFGFWGILFYLILAIIIPEEKGANISNTDKRQIENENHKILIGSSLILLGIFLLIRDTRIFQFFQVWRIFAEYLVPTALIIAGLFLILRNKSVSLPPNKILYRSTKNKKVAGVCAGLGEYLNVDPTVIRILWLIFVFSSFGLGLLIYVLFIIVVPEKQEVINENGPEYN